MNKEKKNNSILKIGVFFTCTLSFVLLILILSRSFLREMDIAFAEDPISALFQTSSFQIPLSFSLSGYGKSAFYYLLKQYLLDPVFLCFFHFIIPFCHLSGSVFSTDFIRKQRTSKQDQADPKRHGSCKK